MFEGKDRTLYQVIGSYQTVKNYNSTRKREETIFQAMLTTLPNGSYVVHYVNKARRLTETAKSTADVDIKSWLDIYLKCSRGPQGYSPHAQVSNWAYKCTRYLSSKELGKLLAKFYPEKQESRS